MTATEIFAAELDRRLNHLDVAVDTIIAAAADVRDYLTTPHPTMAEELNEQIHRSGGL
jgi:hypothetical protein